MINAPVFLQGQSLKITIKLYTMQKKWFKANNHERSTIWCLNQLSNEGITPDCIKILSSSFGDEIYYYHTSEIYISK